MSLEPVDTVIRSRFWLRVWATTTFFCAFSGQFIRNALGYWGFGIVAALLFLSAVTALLLIRPQWKWRWMPKALFAFFAIAAVSVSWSAYPSATVLGVATQLMTATIGLALALTLNMPEIIRTLSVALRWILALSLGFELWVALVVREPLLPNFVNYDGAVPKAFYWSRDLLLHGGPIDGIVANRNLLGFVSLLAMIVFSVQLAAKTVRRGWGIGWLVLAVALWGLTRSATVIAVTGLVAAALGMALWMRRRPQSGRWPVYATGMVAVGAGAFALSLLRSPILALLGKSEDLTGRFGIWDVVTQMWLQRPALGWGWMGYWQPWVSPFDHLAVIGGVTYLQAHNAWLDVAMQLGWLGLLVFVALVGATLWRSWFHAIDRPRFDLVDQRPYSATTLLPLLLAVALIGQSLAESRLLVEGNFILLVVLATVTKMQQWRTTDLP